MNTEDNIPRRAQMDKWIPAERAIFDASQVVEEAGAHPLLTEAVILLGKARAKVADYVELPRSRQNLKPRHSWACANFKASEEDPSFCVNCGDFASSHKGPTPGAPRSFRL